MYAASTPHAPPPKKKIKLKFIDDLQKELTTDNHYSQTV